MRKILSLLAGTAVLAALVFMGPVARANHGDGGGAGWPSSNTATHEDRPTAVLVTNPTDVCNVTGTVSTTAYDGLVVNGTNVPLVSGPGPQHAVGESIEAVNNNPSHTHYQFNDLVLQCAVNGPLSVQADGGNDGHLGDLSNPTSHPKNAHHGSVNLSAWSNQSGYTGCGEGSPANKGDITANGSRGWVKYDRVGTLVIAWGEFITGCGFGPADGKKFSAELVLTPDIDVTGPTGEFAIQGVAVLD